MRRTQGRDVVGAEALVAAANRGWAASRQRAVAEIRSPKSEVRRKAEIRNPNGRKPHVRTAAADACVRSHSAFELRPSDFGLRTSDFGLRISAFHPLLLPRRVSKKAWRVCAKGSAVLKRSVSTPARRKRAVEFGEALGVGIGKLLAHGGAAGIQFEQLARLGVLDGQQPGRRQRAFARVVQMHAHQVVARVGQADFLRRCRGRRRVGGGGAEAVQKIGEQEHDRAPVQHAIQERQRRRDVGAAVLAARRRASRG